MSDLEIIIAVVLAALFLNIGAWALVRGATLGEDDPEEYSGYVDQDGESTPSNAWRS